METIVFNSIQVTNYWFTLHRALRPLYQQAQTSSPNIQGILDQNVTAEKKEHSWLLTEAWLSKTHYEYLTVCSDRRNVS